MLQTILEPGYQLDWRSNFHTWLKLTSLNPLPENGKPYCFVIQRRKKYKIWTETWKILGNYPFPLLNLSNAPLRYFVHSSPPLPPWRMYIFLLFLASYATKFPVCVEEDRNWISISHQRMWLMVLELGPRTFSFSHYKSDHRTVAFLNQWYR